MNTWVFHTRELFRTLRRFIINGFILRGYVKKIPASIILEPTNNCNLRCNCCPQGNNIKAERPTGFMSAEVFDKILENMDTPVESVYLYLHGEPFLNPRLDYFIRRLSEKNIRTIIYSNGYGIDMDLLDRVLPYKKTTFSFSADIVSKTHYETIRQPANYEKMLSHLEKINLLFRKHKRQFELTMIIDEQGIGDRENLAKKFFSQYDCLTKIVWGSRFPWPECFHTGDLEKRLAGKRGLCLQIINTMAVYWNGEASLCSYDFSGRLIAGSLLHQKLSQLYNSPEARRIRRYHYRRQYKKLPICSQCLLPRYKSQTFVIDKKTMKPDEITS